MKIASIHPFILHLPLTPDSISDSTHSITHWGVVGTKIVTTDGLEGYGFTGTHAHLASDRLITACIRECYGPLLIGQDSKYHSWWTVVSHSALAQVGGGG